MDGFLFLVIFVILKNDNDNMHIDKINGDLAFNDAEHKYFNVKYPDRTYTSVTTLIGKYHEKFDSEFWSSYKALEQMMTPEEFSQSGVKSRLLAKKQWSDSYIEEQGFDMNDFLQVKKDILAGYDKTRDEACERGTNYHNAKENRFYEKKEHSLLEYNFGLPLSETFVCEKHNFDLNRENAVLPEYLVYFSTVDEVLNLAGQIDVLIKRGKEIYILDYKTNAKGIETKAYFNPKTRKTKKMFYPINHLDDTTLNHYTLQLSLYAYMLQRIDPELEVKLLRICHVDGEGKETLMDLEYLKDDVEKLLKHYKKEIITQHYRNTGKHL